MDTRQVVLDFFHRKGELPGRTTDEKLGCHYLDDRIIDSMGIVELIGELESVFLIRFSAEDLQSEQFQTVRGLIEVIDRLRSPNGA